MLINAKLIGAIVACAGLVTAATLMFQSEQVVQADSVASTGDDAEPEVYRPAKVRVDHFLESDQPDVIELAIQVTKDDDVGPNAPLVSVGTVIANGSWEEDLDVTEGDELNQGVFKYTGPTEATILFASGRVLELEAGQTFFIGRYQTLDVTHQCVCEFKCGVEDVTVPCDSDRGCSMEGADCRDSQGDEYTLEASSNIWVPIED